MISHLCKFWQYSLTQDLLVVGGWRTCGVALCASADMVPIGLIAVACHIPTENGLNGLSFHDGSRDTIAPGIVNIPSSLLFLNLIRTLI